MYVTNASPNERGPNAIYIPPAGVVGRVWSARLHVGSARLHVGSARLHVGSARLRVGSARVHVGSARLIRYQHVGICLRLGSRPSRWMTNVLRV